MSIKYYTIYGERCSGTNFIEETISTNLDLTIRWDFGWKHWFGFYPFNNKEQEDQTLFICVIRNPIDWLNSLYHTPHHIKLEKTKDLNIKIKNLLTTPIYSYDYQNKLIKEDINYKTKEHFKNIFELRQVKNDYLISIMPTKVKNYLFITYEYFNENTDKVLKDIIDKYNIKSKTETLQRIDYYKKLKDKKYVPRKVIFDEDTIKYIKNNLDKEQEEKLGYKIF